MQNSPAGRARKHVKAECYDAVVIGGGPAGSITAILLVRLGWRVALVERRRPNEGKTCGHCLSMRAIPMLASIGLEHLIRETAVGETDTMLAYTPQSSDHPVAYPAPSLITPRDRLDHRLIGEARACGVHVFQPAAARVRNDRGNEHGGEVAVRPTRDGRGRPHIARAPLLIGADGLRSRVAQAFNLRSAPAPGRKFGFSMRCEAAGDDLPPGMIHMFMTPAGYLGVVRESARAVHAAALVQRAHDEQVRHPHALLRELSESFPPLRVLSDASPSVLAAGPMPDRPRRVAAHGAALVGDAAGYVEPFTGEGMTWAIESAITLAEVCCDTLPGRWTDYEARTYQVQHHRTIARRQRLCRWISSGLQRPWVWQRLMRYRAVSSFLGRRAAAWLQPT